jgi:hypothetical protein
MVSVHYVTKLVFIDNTTKRTTPKLGQLRNYGSQHTVLDGDMMDFLASSKKNS